MHITVITGGTTTELSGEIAIKSDGHVTALNNRAVFEPVYDGVTAGTELAVRTINGVSPNENGEFFLSGSECTSWDMLPDMHGLTLVDLCPACKDCESLYRLKQEVERLKMWLTLLKDVNLYTDTGSSHQINLLWLKRLEKRPDCGEYVLGEDYEAFYNNEAFTKSLQLIQQYMTTVHMWNYVVNRNNMSDVIQVAPEDTAGFSVQTKRALTSCHKSQTIRCTIKIAGARALFDDGTSSDLTGVASDYLVSVFIPRAVLSFEPFDKKQTAVGIPEATTDTTTGVTTNIAILSAETSEAAYCRSVDTHDIEAVGAGTYVMSAKFLPFIYSRMVDKDGNTISIRGTTAYSITPEVEGGTTTFTFFAEDTVPEYKTNPTAKEYLDAKTAPTCSVNFKIVWHIVITWQISGNTTPEIEDYYYTCNGIRRYYSSSVIGPSEIIEGSTTTQVTNA